MIVLIYTVIKRDILSLVINVLRKLGDIVQMILCYTAPVHKPFYASGFLYNLKTQQILLLQSPQTDDIVSSWSMLGGESLEGEEAQATFQRIVQKKLNINLR